MEEGGGLEDEESYQAMTVCVLMRTSFCKIDRMGVTEMSDYWIKKLGGLDSFTLATADMMSISTLRSSCLVNVVPSHY